MTPALSLAMCERILGNSYEKPERDLVASTLRDNDIVMEIGSGLGVISALCAKRIGSRRVFTYEANPELEPLIRETHALNEVSPSLSICLLGEAPGSREFWITREFWASSMIRPNAAAQCVRVPVIPLNEELRRVQPTFLIVDIEGGEVELFDFADLTSVHRIAMEIHPNVIGETGVERLGERLASAGFVLDRALSNGANVYYERKQTRARDLPTDVNNRGRSC